MAIDLGDLYRLTFDNTSPAGDLVSAGSMGLTIVAPDGTPVELGPVTAASPGRYSFDYPTVMPGRHLARWLGTGANPGAHVEAFDVRPPDPAYLISLADAKQQVNIDATVTTHDDELRTHIEAATWAVEDYLRQVVVRRTVSQTLRSCNRTRRVVLARYPAVSLVSATPLGAGSPLDLDELDLDENGIVTALGAPFSGDVRIAYVAGEAIVPANYLLATRIIVAHLWETQRGTAAGAPRVGGAEPGAVYMPRGFALPNRAVELLGGRMTLVP